MSTLKKLLASFADNLRTELSKANFQAGSLFNKIKQKKPKLSSFIVQREEKNSYELFNKKTMQIIKLTKNTKKIIENCDGEKTVEEICKKTYRGPMKNKFIEDTIILLKKLQKEGFISWK